VRRIVFLTGRSPDQVLPAASGLGADLKTEPASADSLARLPDLGPDLVVADAVEDPARAHELLGVLVSAGSALPVLAVLGREDLRRFDWASVADEFVFPEVTEAELRLRLDMLTARRGAAGDAVIRLGAVAINVESYQVTAGARVLDLTFKEFELLRFLARHPGRVFSRAKLLQEVWGYDFYGGTRTVDVHVRRLRAKLGPEHEHLVETVRGVGYRSAENPDTPIERRGGAS
jgi:DNA-binding response OmpR family regulator